MKGVKGTLKSGYCYPNPVYLSDEKAIIMTWRGMNWKPTFSISRDMGKTWSKGQILLSEEAERPSNRPYVKVATDGKGRMHFIATDGHPRNEPTNSVYHFYYEKGGFLSHEWNTDRYSRLLANPT